MMGYISVLHFKFCMKSKCLLKRFDDRCHFLKTILISFRRWTPYRIKGEYSNLKVKYMDFLKKKMNKSFRKLLVDLIVNVLNF